MWSITPILEVKKISSFRACEVVVNKNYIFINIIHIYFKYYNYTCAFNFTGKSILIPYQTFKCFSYDIVNVFMLFFCMVIYSYEYIIYIYICNLRVQFRKFIIIFCCFGCFMTFEPSFIPYASFALFVTSFCESHFG